MTVGRFPFWGLPVGLLERHDNNGTSLLGLYKMSMADARIALRDYQKEMKTRLFTAWRSHRSVLVQMPTGTGKTHLLSSVIRDFLYGDSLAFHHAGGAAVWIIAHRRELVSQIEATLGRYGIDRAAGAVRVMSIQWLSRHWKDVGESPALIVIDEAHHALAATYTELWRRYPAARKLGLTATPCRMNGRGFTDLFDELLTSLSIGEFILRGQLSLFDYVTIGSDSEEHRLISGLERRGADGDYQIKEMESALNRSRSVERLYESVERYACGRKGIVYAISIAHARRIAACYSERGIRAAVIDSRTPAQERRRLVEEFRSGGIRVLVNVDVFSEGFDCPDVEFVQLARPTLSLAKYLQQVGRGLRRSAGKSTCVLIDNVGLYGLFGLPTTAWDWEAMFRGEASGKGAVVPRSGRGAAVPEDMPEAGLEGFRMNMVMSHESLPEALREQAAVPVRRERQSAELKAWQDSENGLWGLREGRRKLTAALYVEVLDLRYGMAAVRFRDRRCGLVDSSGTVLWAIGNCRRARLTRNRFLVTVSSDGKELYTDLLSFRTYDCRPEIKRYGSIELLRIDRVYYSRTKKVYENSWNIGCHQIIGHRFYVTVFDLRAPAGHPWTNDASVRSRGGYVCLLEGDYESYYWMYLRLADGSIIVTDDAGRYYHVIEGREKLYLGGSGTSEEAVRTLARVEELAGQATASCRRQEVQKEEQRRLLLQTLPDAIPFRSGMKWGLKVGGRVTVPPIYRNLRPPVGAYCAVEKNYSQWGIIALDGKVVIEPKYPVVSIGENGTAVLTSVTGKTIAVKL